MDKSQSIIARIQGVSLVNFALPQLINCKAAELAGLELLSQDAGNGRLFGVIARQVIVEDHV